MAGRKPGTPKTGGRKPGTPNKVTADIKALAQVHTQSALGTLVSIMTDVAAAPAARVAAAKDLLDRGYGKPAQTISGDPDNPLAVAVSQITLNGVVPGASG